MTNGTLIALALASTFASGALAAVSADEAKQLGTTLTPVGAEKAGNKDGTIPEWTGGLVNAPAVAKGSGIRPDPFAADKPRLVITGKESAANADKLTAGAQELLKRYPTMRVDVYPTRRAVTFPKWVLDNTAKNAVGAKSVNGGLGVEGSYAGVPFPIPKSGFEVMWNHNRRFAGYVLNYKYDNWNVDSAGVATLALTAEGFGEYDIFNPKKINEVKLENDVVVRLKANYIAPTRRSGEALMVFDSVNPLVAPRRAWQYLPGQRRTRLAPDIGYDTPNPSTQGLATYDDGFVFNGAMDRFDFKLIGKKEMYIPYNSYRLVYAKNPAELLKPGHMNPDFVRWELHRVWVVEATLKEGKRHIYAKRVFYFDEDSWVAVAGDNYDARGQLATSVFSNLTYSYDIQAIDPISSTLYNFVVGAYTVNTLMGPYFGNRPGEPLAPAMWSADSLAGAGIR
jgi:hypothetical protein